MKLDQQQNWWVVVTKPKREITAKFHLTEQGFTVYFPLYQRENLRGRRVNIHTLPLFPRYIFIEANTYAHKKIHSIRSTLGVSRLLKIGEVPMQVPYNLIDDLRLLESKQMKMNDSHFKAGDRVTIHKGPFNGLEAIFEMDDGLQRGVVLITLLQKASRLIINKQQLRTL
jgi:transcriptional antiterminator RfaH